MTSVFLYYLICYITGVELINDKPFLIIGSGEDEVPFFHQIKDFTFHDEKFLYVLDSGNNRIQKFDIYGSFLKTIGRSGQGPGEFYRPSAMISVHDTIWVADYGNGRVQVFQNDQYLKQIKLTRPYLPYNIALSENGVFVSNRSIHLEQGGISLVNFDGEILNNFDVGIQLFNTSADLVWNVADLISISDNRILVGFRYYNNILLVNQNGFISKADLSAYYDIYQIKSKNDVILPDGYSATAFTEGPDGTFLIAACDNEKRNCNLVFQFSSDFTTALSLQKLKHHIWKMKYDAKNDILVLANSEDHILFFHINSSE